MHHILCEDIPYAPNSEELFDALRDLPDAIWLDSGKPRGLQGCFDIISACPDIIVETTDKRSTITDATGVTESFEDPFKIAKQLLNPLLPIDSSVNAPFYSGLIGYFGYDIGRHTVSIPTVAKPLTDLPDMRLGRYLWSLVINHEARKSTLFFHPFCTQSLRQDIRQRLLKQGRKIRKSNFQLLDKFSATVSPQQYRQAIGRIKDYIAAGDCYQANYAQHLAAPYTGDVWQAYLSLRAASPAPYSVFWQWGEKALLSLSPERFLKTSVAAGEVHVETKPIKGTVLRGSSVAEDQENAIRLLNSNKDRAENLMIVDLLRNDLGKTCVPGSIHVPKLFDLESFPNVHHLVSTVTGVLRSDCTAIDLLQGCFPGGSITGAPKKRAMEIIEELEPLRRSAYCGSVGYFCASNQMDTNIAIRTLIADDSQIHCWGGGGIVADSDAGNEFEESMHKIRLLLQTLEAL
ncbi:MAG: aminodeoxychorismate synthase component I [Porticoccaceae bacterium]|nr:aminodeoxychorismate synthase component I [Porticoccaceae bacterium]